MSGKTVTYRYGSNKWKKLAGVRSNWLASNMSDTASVSKHVKKTKNTPGGVEIERLLMVTLQSATNPATNPAMVSEAAILESLMNSDDFSILLSKAHLGSDQARDALFVMLHRQMRENARGLMKSERSNHTLQPTALVNEACLKLMAEGAIDSSANRRQLFHSAIRAMRQILIDHARARATRKRGVGLKRHSLETVLDNFESRHNVSFLDLEAALNRLKDSSPRGHEVLTLRFFGGLSVSETADLIGVSIGTVESDWRFARAKLMVWLEEPEESSVSN